MTAATELRRFKAFGGGWDGYEAEAPDHNSIEHALRLLSMWPTDAPELRPSLHADGYVVLYAGSFEIEVMPDGSLIWLGQRGDGEALPGWREVPADLLRLASA